MDANFFPNGGIVLGSDGTVTTDGELGYASNVFTGFANSENFTLTAAANLWTFASGTSATFAFTPAVGFTAATTHSAGLVVADAQTITFDEAAVDPNDADIVLSGADGVFKIASANGANNEDFTIDVDSTSNTVVFNSTTSAATINANAFLISSSASLYLS